MNLFWIHGGPGYNARPEFLLLDEKIKGKGLTPYYWAHPSALRGDKTENSWQEYSDDLESSFLSHVEKNGPSVLVCHSFGARCSLELIEKYGALIKGVVWIAGATSIIEIFKNLYRLMSEDYQENGLSEKVNLLQNVLEMKDAKLSDYLSQIGVVTEESKFLQYYWTNKELMNSYYPLFVDQWAIDMECFMGVITSMPLTLPKVETNIPALVIWGENEVVVNNSYEENIAGSIFKNQKSVFIDDSSHFPHVENESEFMNELINFTNGLVGIQEDIVLS